MMKGTKLSPMIQGKAMNKRRSSVSDSQSGRGNVLTPPNVDELDNHQPGKPNSSQQHAFEEPQTKHPKEHQNTSDEGSDFELSFEERKWRILDLPPILDYESESSSLTDQDQLSPELTDQTTDQISPKQTTPTIKEILPNSAKISANNSIVSNKSHTYPSSQRRKLINDSPSSRTRSKTVMSDMDRTLLSPYEKGVASNLFSPDKNNSRDDSKKRLSFSPGGPSPKRSKVNTAMTTGSDSRSDSTSDSTSPDETDINHTNQRIKNNSQADKKRGSFNNHHTEHQFEIAQTLEASSSSIDINSPPKITRSKLILSPSPLKQQRKSIGKQTVPSPSRRHSSRLADKSITLPDTRFMNKSDRKSSLLSKSLANFNKNSNAPARLIRLIDNNNVEQTSSLDDGTHHDDSREYITHQTNNTTVNKNSTAGSKSKRLKKTKDDDSNSEMNESTSNNIFAKSQIIKTNNNLNNITSKTILTETNIEKPQGDMLSGIEQSQQKGAKQKENICSDLSNKTFDFAYETEQPTMISVAINTTQNKARRRKKKKKITFPGSRPKNRNKSMIQSKTLNEEELQQNQMNQSKIIEGSRSKPYNKTMIQLETLNEKELQQSKTMDTLKSKKIQKKKSKEKENTVPSKLSTTLPVKCPVKVSNSRPKTSNKTMIQLETLNEKEIQQSKTNDTLKSKKIQKKKSKEKENTVPSKLSTTLPAKSPAKVSTKPNKTQNKPGGASFNLESDYAELTHRMEDENDDEDDTEPTGWQGFNREIHNELPTPMVQNDFMDDPLENANFNLMPTLMQNELLPQTDTEEDKMIAYKDVHSNSMKKATLIHNPNGLLWKPSGNEDVEIARYFNVPSLVYGQLKLKAYAKKGLKKSHDNIICFILHGRVKVLIYRTSREIPAGGTFLVPHGNAYAIENLCATETRILFTQIKA